MKLPLKYERQDKSGDCISFVVYKTSLEHLFGNQIKGSSDFQNLIWCFVFT